MKKFAIFFPAALIAAATVADATEYLSLVSKDAAADPGWKEVGEKLSTLHSGKCEVWDGTENGLVETLKKHQPRYLAIIGKPESFKATTVRAINRATRMADDDPWTDCRWGLITGNTPQDAMRLVESRKPLIIRRALTTTGIDLSLVDSALTINDGKKGNYTHKLPGKPPEKNTWDEKVQPTGTVNMFADYWNKEDPQLLVTSSHATQFNLEMPYGLGLIASHGGKFHVLSMQQRNEFAKFLGGAMFTGNVVKLGEWIESTKAPTLTTSKDSCRVWMASGNCLIGDAKGTNHSMVVCALSTAGFRQFVGYVVPTWFGRSGWGTSGLWQNSRGGLSLSEAFFLNTQCLIDETLTRFPGAEKINFDAEDIQEGLKTDHKFIEGLNKLMPVLKTAQKDQKDLIGLIHDRDVVAFWGDPLWEARFDPTLKPHAIKASWKAADNTLTLTLTANDDFEGAYPLWLPKRIPTASLTIPDGVKVDAVASDDFILIRKLTLKKGETVKLGIASAKTAK
ncbi:MAG: hypothetical protein WCS43_04210 [Verrucomicrobiota bacterium]